MDANDDRPVETQPGAPGRVDLADWIGAALDWWRDAGVDADYAENPQDWLEAAKAKRAAANPASHPADTPAESRKPETEGKAVRIGGERDRWPDTAEAFATWWLTEPTLCPLPAERRVPPSGPAGAPLMVLVPMPEAEDTNALMTGAQGRLLDSMLRAMSLSRDAIYVASVLPARIAAPDWQALAAGGMGDIAAHHIALASPQRLLVLGRTDISPLLGNDPAKSAPFEPIVNHEGQKVAAFADYGLDVMLARPGLKAGVWSRWLQWTAQG
ncbi:hypothetical protein RXV95_10480 [Novosphingobium sp. ZN18A2]|uniref:uracil-DNA glycosylase family protein n=1 Tax=Novosphingobium sp. ZN18A2 TaxID=3079861 RepID=UPI0030CEF34A